MRGILKIAFLVIVGMTMSVPIAWGQQSALSGKRERGYIREGNKLYNDKRYPDAEVAYRKALQENESSEVAMYNLASALIRQASLAAGEEDGQNNPAVEAQKIFGNLATSASDAKLAENSLYNLGNIAFNQEQYEKSIDMYKRALRKNPDNDKARENLRLAQLKLEEQQNQNQDQNQNKDQNQQEQDQDQQDQQNKQDQDQNQDKNQNQQDQQDQNQQEQDQDQQDQNNDNDRQDDRNGISDRNAEQILKAMENEENATRRKIEARRAQEELKKASKSKTGKPW